MNAALSGRRILLTRPAGQVEPLRARLREHGADAQHFAAMEIAFQPPDAANLSALDTADLIAFASVNAVHGLARAADRLSDMPRRCRIAAIGPATAAALREAGVSALMESPPPYNSEALLAAPEMQELNGQNVVIVRGQGGREKLAEELRRRGAQVRYLEVYRRACPDAALSLRESPPEAVCITSVEIAENLLRCAADDREALLQCPVVAGNARITAACRKLGYRSFASTAENPGDDAMTDALIRYFESLESR